MTTSLNKSGVYAIVNLINRKKYIGSTNNLRKRWGNHKSTLRRNISSNKFLQKEWFKFGESSFKFVVLEYTEELKDKEQFYLDNNKNLYNICTKAFSNLGTTYDDEFKKRVSEVHKGKIAPNRRSVIQYDLKMNYINTYKSLREAATAIGISYTYISMVASGKKKQGKGYIFKYKL